MKSTETDDSIEIMKVVIAEPVNTKLQELISGNNSDWVVYADSPKDKKELISRLKDADAATSYSIKYDAEIFEACPKLKYLAIPAVGANYFVDMEAASEYGVTVMNCPGYNSRAVAELALSMAISVARKVPSQQHELSNGLWHGESHGFQISGKKVGIIGNGNVSKVLQELLEGWSVEITVTDSKSTQEEVDNLFEANQVFFVCCPLNDSTKGLVSSDRISKMSEDSIIVNVGRGAVIDEEALYKALSDNKIFGAALDVFSEEPEYGNNLSQEISDFYELNNTLVTPHVAGNSFESSERLAEMIYENLTSVIQKNPINVYI